ncbi:bifunctional aminoglycoside phosphotransferase/ATP-binding protein [Gordonia sp. NPDC003424]
MDRCQWLIEAGAVDPAQPTHRIDTHAASVFLNGNRAWKFKRPVRFRYLDFTTADRRHAALDAELRLNRRTAPHLYRAVHAVTRDDDGHISLDGPGKTLDWVLEMTRFPDDAPMINRATPGGLDDRLLQTLAGRIAELHRAAEVSCDPRGAARLQEVVDGNLISMTRFPNVLDVGRAKELTDRLTGIVGAHADLLDARAGAGRVRHCHGDLHLGNIAIIDGAPVPFDCLEFDPEMATTDVLYDLAFLVMDLWARGLHHEANVVVNAYLDESPDDDAGFGLLPVMMSVRATVRAHVCAAEGLEDDARDYLGRALRLVDTVPPRLIAIGGASGTGKSTVARAVGGDFVPPPGARVLRSDVLRKRLAGVPMDARLPRSSYTPEARGQVYDELTRLAEQTLRCGMSVIADAVFGEPAQRDAIETVASRAGCEFTGVWLEVPEAERIARIEARGPDPSDADATVARRQTTTLIPPTPPTTWLPNL